MKLALPIVTLVLCASFLIFRQSSLQSVATKNENLEGRIRVVESGGPVPAGAQLGKSSRPGRPGSGSGGSEGRGQLPRTVAEIDLESLAQMALEARAGGEMRNLKLMLKMQELILEATAEELKDLIARTEALEMPAEVKEGMIEEFLGALGKHEPEQALMLALQSEHMTLEDDHRRLSEMFTNWAKQDPSMAVAWFDREMAKGTFESRSLDGARNEIREFQAVAIGAALLTDPAEARRRLESIPAENRAEVLRDSRFRGMVHDHPVEYAALVREALPEAGEREGVFSASGRDLVSKGYEAVSEFVTQINATRSERNAIAGEAAKQKFQQMGWRGNTPGMEEVAELTSFLESQSHPDPAHATGESLARFGSTNNNMEAALDLMTRLQDTSPDESLILGFFESTNNVGEAQRPLARQLINRVQDPAKRQALLEQYQ